MIRCKKQDIRTWPFKNTSQSDHLFFVMSTPPMYNHCFFIEIQHLPFTITDFFGSPGVSQSLHYGKMKESLKILEFST